MAPATTGIGIVACRGTATGLAGAVRGGAGAVGGACGAVGASGAAAGAAGVASTAGAAGTAGTAGTAGVAGVPAPVPTPTLTGTALPTAPNEGTGVGVPVRGEGAMVLAAAEDTGPVDTGLAGDAPDDVNFNRACTSRAGAIPALIQQGGSKARQQAGRDEARI